MRNALNLLILILALPTTTTAQNRIPEDPLRSTGYDDPSDIEALRSYRLPDWSYRLWDVDADFGVSGSEKNNSVASRSYLQSNLATSFVQYAESERRIWSVESELNGGANRTSRTPDAGDELYRRMVATGADLNATLHAYVTDSVFGVLEAGASGSYNELLEESGNNRSFRANRLFLTHARVGFGWGRVRNVTPLIRAQRVSERLVELNRPALSGEGVRDLAANIAREGGYRVVFDREEKYFWNDVLGGLAGAQPLTPFETLYLTDVLSEGLGQRLEGMSAELSGMLQIRADEAHQVSLGPGFECTWSRNTSLSTQLQFAARGHWLWGETATSTYERGLADVVLAHLWNVADRIRWQNSVRGIQQQLEPGDGGVQRITTAQLRSSLDIYVEDSIIFVPRAELNYHHDEAPWGEDSAWDWGASFSVTYLLDRFLS